MCLTDDMCTSGLKFEVMWLVNRYGASLLDVGEIQLENLGRGSR